LSYPFFIWTIQRTGGTSLTELLMKMSEHKAVEHEPFNWRYHKPRQFGAVARNWVETQDLPTLQAALHAIFSEHYLIKHCYELHGTPLNVQILRAAAKTNYRHILLLRRDELSRLASKFIAEANGTWFKDYADQVYAGIASQKRKLQPLPVGEVVATYEHCRRTTDRIREVLNRLDANRREIWYEDIFTGDRETRLANLHELFHFLGFTPGTIAAHQDDIEEKIFRSGQNTGDILQFVPNLAEVRQALAAAGLEPTDKNPAHTQETMTVTQNDPVDTAAAPRVERPLNDDDAATIHTKGYRAFVGGPKVWETIGTLQFDFLKRRGMKPHDKMVDVACGALRGGIHYIRYLNAGNYYGIDKHIELVIYGVAKELTIPVFREKMPHFAISDAFEFNKLGSGFTYGIAQSLFSHLIADDIRLCLSNLHAVAADGCKFYATFFECEVAEVNPEKSHSAAGFKFTRGQMEAFGADTGWEANYIGTWGHPRGQRVIEYVRPAR
jgi:hypothetical protein